MSDDEPRRVRLESPDAADRQGRTGCLALGAVLGVIAGVMVALYVLPPVLKSLYGEKAVAPGEARTVDGTTFRVLGYQVGPDAYCAGLPGCPAASIQVSVSVLSEEGWQPDVEDLLVEVEGIDSWIEAMDPVQGGEGETGIDFPAGVERTVVLRFPLPLGATPDETTPEAVHITTPRVKLELDDGLRK